MLGQILFVLRKDMGNQVGRRSQRRLFLIKREPLETRDMEEDNEP